MMMESWYGSTWFRSEMDSLLPREIFRFYLRILPLVEGDIRSHLQVLKEKDLSVKGYVELDPIEENCDLPVSTYNVKVPNFEVMPNPFTDFLTVRQDGRDVIEIWDFYGRKIFYFTPSKSNSTLDLSLLHPGIYIVKIRGGQEVKKVVKL